MKHIYRPWSLIITTIFIALISALRVSAQTPLPFISPVFTDNMVLQRDTVDHIWGWAAQGTTVTVTLGKARATAVAADNGEWCAAIGPLKAGGPYTLTVAGPQTTTFSNVLVGDVWLCSGQSNMEFGIGNSINGQQEIAQANYPNIRLFTVNKTTALTPQALTSGQWLPVTPQNIMAEGTWNGFSAVGYFFARDLQSSVNVPIGLIQSSWGGTPAEAWTSKEALLQAEPSQADAVNAINPANLLPQNQRTANWYAKYDPGASGNWQDPAADVSEWKPIPIPGYYQQAGIPALQGVNGIIWFRSTFDLPSSDVAKDGVIHLLVDDNDTTWINGTLVGATDGAGAQRTYAVPAALLKPTGNVIVVRDYDTGGIGGIYGDPAGLKLSFASGVDVPLAGQWLYRFATPASQLSGYPVAIVGNQDYPTLLFNGMINPIDQFAIKGVLWYQGEANSQQPQFYQSLLSGMISDWRTRWNQGNFPFFIVQLAGWQPGTTWPEFRHVQWLTAETVPNSGIVTAVDIGLASNIHPTNKQEVGRRLALLAEAKVYRKKVPFSGPVYLSSQVNGAAIQVSFDQLDGGLVAEGGAPLTGFEIAGSDGTYYPADAVIVGDTIMVSAQQVPTPTVVRYDWASYPNGNLFNKAGLPAFPFKTDEK